LKRKKYQTLWELESIYYRVCRLQGCKPSLIEQLPRVDNGMINTLESISLLKKEIVRIVCDI